MPINTQILSLKITEKRRDIATRRGSAFNKDDLRKSRMGTVHPVKHVVQKKRKGNPWLRRALDELDRVSKTGVENKSAISWVRDDFNLNQLVLRSATRVVENSKHYHA